MKIKVQHPKTYCVPRKQSSEESVEPQAPAFKKSGCSQITHLLMCLGVLEKQVKFKTIDGKELLRSGQKLIEWKLKTTNNTKNQRVGSLKRLIRTAKP